VKLSTLSPKLQSIFEGGRISTNTARDAFEIMVMHKFNRIVIDGFKDFDTCDGEGGNIVEMGLYPRVSNFTFLNDHDRCINAGANFFFRLQTWSFVDLELSYPENSIYLNDYSDEVNFLGGVRSGLIIPGLTL